MATTSPSPPHFVIFPFMAQGHTIPLLYLARLLFQRGISVTIFTTPSNHSSIRLTLQNDAISLIVIPFPENIAAPATAPVVEITDKFPSMSSFNHFVTTTKQIQPRFEEAVQNLQSVSCIISDAFLSWTQESAEKLGIPRLVFFGTNNFSMTMLNIIVQERPHAAVSSEDEPFPVPSFPRFKLTKNDFGPPFTELAPKSENFDELELQTMFKSHGLIVNSFYELEPAFNEYWNQNIGPKAWCIGPLCLAKPPMPPTLQNPTWVQWLDLKLTTQEPVLYVAFGSQAEVSREQLQEIAIGLEKSKVSFLWVLKPKQLEFLEGFEERVKGRGMIVKDWVDQMEILEHEIVHGFLSLCGWNSTLESISAGVPVLALPMMADQHMNARMVVEDIGVGLRVWPSNKSARGIVGSEEVRKMVKELMEGEEREVLRKKVKEVREAACNAMKEGGSSWCTLNLLIDDICGKAVEFTNLTRPSNVSQG